MNPQNTFHKLFAPTVLPYRINTFEVDERELRQYLRDTFDPELVNEGILGHVINSEAGEIFVLNRAQRRRTVEIALEESNGRYLVFAGTTGTSTQEAVTTAQDAIAAGADGVFVLPPHGMIDVSMTWDPVAYPEVIVNYVRAIAEAIDGAPIIMHPTGPRSPQYGIGLPVNVVEQICTAVESIVGWKMTYNYEGYTTVAEALRSMDRDIAVLGASAAKFHENLAAGLFDGMVTGSLNYSMEAMVQHTRAWQADDATTARKIWNDGLVQLQRFVYSDYSRLHPRYKLAVWLRGKISNPLMSPPVTFPRRKEVEQLHSLLSNIGVHVRTKDEVDAYLTANGI